MNTLPSLLRDFGLTHFLLLCLVGGAVWVGMMMRQLITNHLYHVIDLLEDIKKGQENHDNHVLPAIQRLEDIWERVRPEH